MDAPMVFDLGLALGCAVFFFFALWAYNVEYWMTEFALIVGAISVTVVGLAHAFILDSLMRWVVWGCVMSFFLFEAAWALRRRRSRMRWTRRVP